MTTQELEKQIRSVVEMISLLNKNMQALTDRVKKLEITIAEITNKK